MVTNKMSGMLGTSGVTTSSSVTVSDVNAVRAVFRGMHDVEPGNAVFVVEAALDVFASDAMAQGAQTAELFAPTTALNVPKGQNVQKEEAGASAKVPPGQGLHFFELADPDAGL